MSHGYAYVAQQVAHSLGKAEVTSSNLVVSSIKSLKLNLFGFNDFFIKRFLQKVKEKMYNLISLSIFMFVILFGVLISKSSRQEIVLRCIAAILLTYKFLHYLISNIKGVVSVPVEISALSYFLVSFIVLFKIKKLYIVGSFFGIIAGLGYMWYYTLFGFATMSHVTVPSLVIASFCHSTLLILGCYLLGKQKFEKPERRKIWIAVFAMLTWAEVFYSMQEMGKTLIYYLIRPEFLFFSASMPLNVLCAIGYYAALTIMFYGTIKMFYIFNECAVNDGDEQVSNHASETAEANS